MPGGGGGCSSSNEEDEAEEGDMYSKASFDEERVLRKLPDEREGEVDFAE